MYLLLGNLKMSSLKPVNNHIINNLDALIVSAGGNATTSFMTFLLTI